MWPSSRLCAYARGLGTALVSDEEIRPAFQPMRLKDSPVPFERLAVGSVLSNPRGRRFMKIMLGNRSYWVPSVLVSKTTWTDEEMLGNVEDDWEVWL